MPLSWYSEIEDHVNGVNDLWGHDNGSINGINHVNHSSSDDGQDALESLNFLEQENVKRNKIKLSGLSKTLWSSQVLESLLNIDPDEKNNIAENLEYSSLALEMKLEIEKRWQYKDLEKVFDQEKIALEDINDIKSSHISDSKSHHSDGIDDFL